LVKTFKTKFDRAFPLIYVDYKNPESKYGMKNVEKNV
jgi:hypothetical protein